jgi:acyl-CoA reductase-like NAD-dependent aldehyde dehydrogenase
MVTGDNSTSRWLAEQESVSAVTVTGSAAAGHALQEVCARRGLPFQAELNGNNAALLWDGADLRAAAAQVASGALAFAGQRCTANRRVIVPAAQFDPVWEALESAANALVWGDPMEMATRIGPVLTEEKRNELVRELVEVEKSGRVHRLALTHGGLVKQAWVREGAYVQPALIACDDADDALVREESMGPRLIVQRAQDFEHALALLNGVRQGLIASMFGGSTELRRRFLEEARAGVLKFDQGTAGVDVTLPFGGWKSSGVGPPEHGEADRQFYSRLQAVYGAVGDE